MIGLYAGRFQPFHLGHLGAIRHVMSECDDVYVLICSKQGANPLDDKNPFTFEERRQMMQLSNVFDNDEDMFRLHFRHICDQTSDEEWARVIEKETKDGEKVCYTNNPRTQDAFQAHGYNVKNIPVQQNGINASLIRKLIIRNEKWEHLVPDGTEQVIEDVRNV